jgi:hypothetical protein
LKFEGSFNFCRRNTTLGEPQANHLEINWNFIFSLLGMRSHHMLNLGLFWYFVAWGFNSRFNSAAETLLLVNYKPTTLESIETSYSVYWDDIAPYIKFWLILILAKGGFNYRFNFAANWSYKGFGYLDMRELPINWVFFCLVL